MVIKLGYDLSIVKSLEEIIKRKNADIRTLKKRLKHPSTEDPQPKEVAHLEKDKEYMFKIILEQNKHINEMETEKEKLFKEK